MTAAEFLRCSFEDGQVAGLRGTDQPHQQVGDSGDGAHHHHLRTLARENQLRGAADGGRIRQGSAAELVDLAAPGTGSHAATLPSCGLKVHRSAGMLRHLYQTLPTWRLRMRIGVLKEAASGERRVALTPDGAARLVRRGLEVVVEAGAGEGAWFSDEAYGAAGAIVA